MAAITGILIAGYTVAIRIIIFNIGYAISILVVILCIRNTIIVYIVNSAITIGICV